MNGEARRVAVVGGGVLGCSTALHLARGGATVRWLSDTHPAAGASGRSLAWLNSAGTYSPAYHALRLQGIQRYQDLAAAATRPWLGLDGGLRWARSGGEGDLREVHEHLLSIGYRTEWLTHDEVVERFPEVEAARVPDEGAVWNADEGWVDLPSLIAEMTRELESLGCTLQGDVGPVSVLTESDRVVGVRTGGDSWPADAVVVATGAGVPAALAEVGVTVPDDTSTGLVVRTQPLSRPLRIVLHTPRVAIRPAPDGGLVMDAGWSERQVTTGPDGSLVVRRQTVDGLLAEASRVLADGPELRLASYAAGPKPIPGDGEPVLGRVPQVEGYHVAFTHSGATLALVAGELVADGVLRGEDGPELAAFSPARFG